MCLFLFWFGVAVMLGGASSDSNSFLLAGGFVLFLLLGFDVAFGRS